MGKEKKQEVPMIAAAFQRVCDLQAQIKTTNTMLYDSWGRERYLGEQVERLLSKLGEHECPNCGQTCQETIVDCDPGETGDTTRYCNSCYFSWRKC
tara:strand:+ start:547 stop:834 length:288 start_codon:yes stop_codon:yes gene_type:complete